MLPHMAEEFSGDSRLAKHRHRASLTVKPLHNVYEHPFRNIEVALTGQCVKTAMSLKILLYRQVRSAVRADNRVCYPRWVADHEHRFGKLGCKLSPFKGK